MSATAATAAVVATVVTGIALRPHTRSSPRRTTPAVSGRRPAALRTRRHARRGLIATLALGVVVVFGPFLAGAILVGRYTLPRVRRHIRSQQQRVAVELAIPDTIELLVLVIRAGSTPHHAVGAMATRVPAVMRPGFGEVINRLQRGQGLADALSALPETLGPSMMTVADTLAMAERHGSPIGEALAQLSADARQRRRRLAEADARKLPVRLSFPLVFCTLPSFVLVAIAPAVLAALSSLGDTTW